MSENVEYTEVVEAVGKLESEGKRPTIAGVRAALGNRGGVTQIAKHLKEWKKEQMAVSSEPVSNDQPSAEQLDSPEPKVSSKKLESAQSSISPKAAPKDPVVKKDFSPKADEKSSTVQTDSSDKKSSGLFRSKNTRKKQTGPADDYAEKVNMKEDFLTSQVDFEPLTTQELSKLDKQTLIIKIRQLQSILTREKNRTETAEKLTREANDYANAIKDQVGHRINDLKESMTVQITQLRNQMREFKQQAEEDLNYYRKQLEKANSMLAESKLKG